jgi:hypothetical protein
MDKECSLIGDAVSYLDAISYDLDLENVHWVHGGDEAADWCYDCCKAMVRHLRKKDKKNRKEYCVDGGWSGGESDNTPFCAGCGKMLAYSLTKYGMDSEFDHFLNHDFFCCDGSIDPYTAYELSAVIGAARCFDDEETSKKAHELANIIMDNINLCFTG